MKHGEVMVPASPGWVRPDDVMKARKLKVKRHALQARMSSSAKPLLVPRSGKTASVLHAKRNPFRRSPAKKAPESGAYALNMNSTDLSTDVTLFNLLHNPLLQSKPAVDSSSPYTFTQALRLQGIPTSEETKEPITVWQDHLNVDWSLKTSLRFTADKPLPWKHNFKTCEEASGTTGMARCLWGTKHSSELDTSPNTEFYQRCLVWQHPSLPGVSLFPRDGSKATSAPSRPTGPGSNSNGFSSGSSTGPYAGLSVPLLGAWCEALRSLHQLVRVRQCPYFYVCAPSFTVVYRAAGVCGIPHAHALVTPTTRGLRRAMKEEGIEFKMPLCKHSSQTQGDTSKQFTQTQGDTSKQFTQTQGDTSKQFTQTQGDTSKQFTQTQGDTNTSGSYKSSSESSSCTSSVSWIEFKMPLCKHSSQTQGDTSKQFTQTRGDTSKQFTQTQGDTSKQFTQTQGDTSKQFTQTQGDTSKQFTQTQGDTNTSGSYKSSPESSSCTSSISSPSQSTEFNSFPATEAPQHHDEDVVDDGEDATSFLENLGVDTSQFASLNPNRVQKSSLHEIDRSPLSLVYISDPDTHGLTNFLLNSPSCVANTGPLAGVPPTLLAPVAFQGATLLPYKVKGSSIRTEGRVQYSMEVTGPILPHTPLQLCSLLTQHLHSFQLTATPLTNSLAFSTCCPYLHTSPMSKAFAEEGLVDCGLEATIRSTVCESSLTTGRAPDEVAAEGEDQQTPALPLTFRQVKYEDGKFTWTDQLPSSSR
ncbi:Donson [Trinorchestia longiramus]|nr:Donson [Trinorchestia longiramus]